MKFILLLGLCFSTIGFAEEVEVFRKKFDNQKFQKIDRIITKFYVDDKSAQGYLILKLQNHSCSIDPARLGRDSISPMKCEHDTFMTYKTPIEWLELMEEKLVYKGEVENVTCGKMGRSRFLRTPTLYLNGNCEFEVQTIKNEDGSGIIKVNLLL